LSTNPHWARVVVYGLFSLCVIHTEGLDSGNINRLMMMMIVFVVSTFRWHAFLGCAIKIAYVVDALQ
jgi:hypothetical protein